jgi:hypothetical protein
MNLERVKFRTSWHIKHLEAAARYRKPGYLKEILRVGRRDGDVVHLRPDQFARIRVQFEPRETRLKRGRDAPTWPAAIKNAAREGTKWLLAGAPVPASDILHGRSEICAVCPQWNPKAWLGTGGCRKCRCSRFKLFMETSKCPLKKW